MSRNKKKGGCGKKDGFGRKCGDVFEVWKDGTTGKVLQEIRYYCPKCKEKLKCQT